MNCFHRSVLSPGSILWCGVMATGSYLWNEWHSHPINIYFMVIKRCIISTGRFVPWVSMVVWGHAWVLPLKWMRLPPNKYIFDGHQKMHRFHWSSCPLGQPCGVGVMPGSYLLNEWHSQLINIYLVVIKRMYFFHWSSCPLGQPCGVDSEMSEIPTLFLMVIKRCIVSTGRFFPGSTTWCGSWTPGSYLWNEWDFPHIFDGHHNMYCFHWSSFPWVKLVVWVMAPLCHTSEMSEII
jgi:hypothetical protein